MIRPSSVRTVLHVEDDPLWVDVLALRLSQWPEVTSVGFTTTAHDGLALCRERRPDIVLLDLWLPDGDGFQLVDGLAELRHPPQVLLLTCRSDDYTMGRAWFGGVAGLVWKLQDCAAHLRVAFASLASGRRYFPSEVLAAVRKFRSSPEAYFKILSPSELLLMPALCEGESDEVIAANVNLGRETVHTHRQHILRKLGLTSSAALMSWGRDHGFAPGLLSAPPCVARCNGPQPVT